MTQADEDIRAHIEREVASAFSWRETSVAQEQARNLSYYFGNKLGDEAEGRSQLVSWDVFEVVETATPELIEPFFSEENIVELDPVTLQDIPFAKEATEYINHKLLKCSNAFDIFQSWVKDGLALKIGVVRVHFDKTRHKQRKTYRGLDMMRLTMLMQEPGIEIASQESQTGPDGVERYEVDVIHDRGYKGLRYEAVAPENFIISRDASNDSEVTTIGELRCYRASDLVEMGFKKDVVDELSDFEPLSDNETLRSLREQAYTRDRESDDDGANREIVLFYGFTKYDKNKDGIAEWRRVLMGGHGDPLEDDEVADHDYAYWTPIKVPHRIIGMAYADPVAPIQELNTALQRQYVDSLFLANNPRTYAVDGQVAMDDLLDNRIGGVVRMKQPGMAGPLQTSLVAVESMQGLEWGKSMRENRIGVLRNGAGLDKDSLNPRTAKEITVIETSQQRRMKVALRNFAEMGVKNLVRKALRLCIEHQDEPESIYDGKMLKSYNPANWNPEMAVTIRVGLGTGDNTETLNALQMFGQFMQMVAAQGMPMVQPANIYEFGRQLAKAAKLKPEALITDPQQAPPQQPKPSPEEIKAKAQMAIKQMEIQASTQADAQKFQAEQAERARVFQVEQAVKMQAEEQKYAFESTEADKQRAHEERLKSAEIQASQEKELLALASGIIAAKTGSQGQNLVNGTQTDQSAQAPGISVGNIAQIMQSIREAAGALGGGMQVNDVENAIFSALNPPKPVEEVKPDSNQLLAEAMDRLSIAMTAPEVIDRDQSGRAIGKRKVLNG